MKINSLKLFKNHQKYDWIVPYLHSEVKLTPRPYLWTRIRAHLIASPKTSPHLPELIVKLASVWRLILPLILIITLSFGAYIGFELANNLQHLRGMEKKFPQQFAPSEIEPMLDSEIDPLNLKLLDE